MSATQQPHFQTPCRQCGRGLVPAGQAVCTTCARRILRQTCPHNGEPETVVTRARNGALQPRLRCTYCFQYVGAKKLRDTDLNAVTAFTVQPVDERCSHCGRADQVETHHWAPYHLFPDADHWPTSPLCPDCHRLWHTTTRTAKAERSDAA